MARRTAPEWYREREEPERTWEGRLERRVGALGPAARGGLGYELDVGDERLPVYSVHLGDRLEPLVGRRVTVRAKIIDLSAEGYGRELWPAGPESFSTVAGPTDAGVPGRRS